MEVGIHGNVRAYNSEFSAPCPHPCTLIPRLLEPYCYSPSLLLYNSLLPFDASTVDSRIEPTKLRLEKTFL